MNIAANANAEPPRLTADLGASALLSPAPAPFQPRAQIREDGEKDRPPVPLRFTSHMESRSYLKRRAKRERERERERKRERAKVRVRSSSRVESRESRVTFSRATRDRDIVLDISRDSLA